MEDRAMPYQLLFPAALWLFKDPVIVLLGLAETPSDVTSQGLGEKEPLEDAINFFLTMWLS